MRLLASGSLLTLSLTAAFVLVTAPGCEDSAGFPDDEPSGSELDADGDGVADDLGEGVDADGDGELDEFETGVAVDTDGDGEPDAAGLDTDDDGIIDALDTDFDGEPDVFTELGDDPRGGGDGDGDTTIDGITGGDAGGSNQGNGEPEVCDGKDNDDNGIIDDVDAGGDGICDCLNIGTIGTIGPWSDGGDIFATWLDERSPIPATALDDEVLSAENLTGLDVIVVLRVDTSELSGDPPQHVFSAGEAKAFGDWMRAGGGAMTTIGYTGDEGAEIVNVNRLLTPLGAGYSEDLSLSGDVSTWLEHPISDGVSNIFTENGVTVSAEAGTLVAVGQNDKAVMVVHQVEDGRLVVWGDEWITYDSEWVDTEGQQVELLWLNIIKWLSPPTRCQVPIPPQIIR
jgi:hypothetical protein